MEKTIVYDPVKEYKEIYKDKFHQKVVDGFDKKIQACGIDLDANNELTNKIERLENRDKDQGNNIKKVRTAFIIVTILCVVGILAGVILYFKGEMLALIGIIVGVLALIGLIVEIILFKKKLKVLNEANDETKSSLDDLRNLGLKQMYEYNHHASTELFDQYFKGMLPGVELERFVSDKTFATLDQHGADLRFSDCSCIGCKSGTINDNPFLIINNRHHYMGKKTYYGETRIEWDEVTVDEKGNRTTEHKTQTLTASVTKPYPEYNAGAALYYYCDASKNLVFDRLNHTEFCHATEKQYRSYVDKHEKHLRKEADQAVKDNRKFTPIANLDFETLFQAWNRNSEVDYRLLFTPLAQTNMCKVITDSPIADTLDFKCRHGLNILTSKNICNQQLDFNRYSFVGYSAKRLKEQIVNILDEAFKEMYFSLAPLLAIPSYQQTDPETPCESSKIFSPLEEEFFANMLPQEHFLLPESMTRPMIHAVMSEQYGTLDIVTLRCTSYRIEKHTEVFVKHGDDGNDHNVYVDWDEYIEIEKEVQVALKKLANGDRTFNAFLRRFEDKYSYLGDYVVNKGVLAFIANPTMRDDFNKQLDDFFDPLSALK